MYEYEQVNTGVNIDVNMFDYQCKYVCLHGHYINICVPIFVKMGVQMSANMGVNMCGIMGINMGVIRCVKLCVNMFNLCV